MVETTTIHIFLDSVTLKAGEAAEGVNNAFGGASGGLRGILDGIFSIQDWFTDTFRFLKGTFTGDWT